MTGSSQSPRDRILWILTNRGGKMERSRLRRCTGMRYADMDPIIPHPAGTIFPKIIFHEISLYTMWL